MAKDKIPKELNESMEQPLRTGKDKDAAVTGSIMEGSTKMSSHSGLPHKHGEGKMPHEHFQDKMTKALC